MRRVHEIAACFRAAGPNENAVAKAARQLRESPDEATRAAFEQQLALDADIARTLQAAVMPASIVHVAEAAAARARISWRQHLRQPPIAAALVSILVFLGLLAYLAWDRYQDFPGKAPAIRMIDVADGMSGLEMEPVEITADNLGDWLFMKHRLEHYDAPPEFAGMQTALARTLTLDQKRVAQIAFEEPQSLLYIFRAGDFPRVPEASETWRLFHHGAWAGAIRRQADLCYVLTFRGGDAEMKSFLATKPLP